MKRHFFEADKNKKIKSKEAKWVLTKVILLSDRLERFAGFSLESSASMESVLMVAVFEARSHKKLLKKRALQIRQPSSYFYGNVKCRKKWLQLKRAGLSKKGCQFKFEKFKNKETNKLINFLLCSNSSSDSNRDSI